VALGIFVGERTDLKIGQGKPNQDGDVKSPLQKKKQIPRFARDDSL